ncbi:hypothetical protein PPACK8108_LOCUS24846 [Phakopsora pachyrhizi]|uniref:Uncharacterized protein n=1 Tax=Phakopsora pachyrhizi TaxID=170000 RepID=A0AAV0BSQ9_PHAPC|nr:hypothetical protein PPACK8108_LOCUS24846 [Phakopsora pachyrhizi]
MTLFFLCKQVFDDQSALIQAYQREIMSLKSKLQQNSQALSNSISSSSLPVLAEINAEKSKAESELTNLRIERIKLQEQIEHLNRRILSRNNIEASIHQVDTSSRPRRIVSGQERGPKKFKGRVTDLGGMVGLIGIGLRPGYLNGGMADSENSTPVKDYNSLKQFQKEFRLEEEVKTLRRELDKLRKEKEQLSLSASSSTTSCIKSATPSLEDPKDVVQNILHENLCEDVFGFKLCGAAPEQNFEKSQQPLEEIEENEERLLFQNSNRSVSTLCNDVKKHFNQNHRETKLAGTQTETVSDNNANQEFFLLETMLRNENKELEKKLSLLTIEHDELKAIQKSSLNKSQETPERPQTESGVSSAERDHTSAVQAELSQALDVISKLELEDKQKEVILKESTLENERLFEQLRKADERVKLLEEKSLERKKKIESDKRSISEKSKIFEARISELQALLDSERQAKKEADDELAARNDEYQAQIDLDLKLQKDLATLKTKLEKFEKKIAAERCKTNEKELEVMNIMQERDQLAHLLETQSLQLDNLAATHKQDADTLVAELEEMLLRSEATADELQKNNNKLSQARQLSESKLKEVREDISESKIKFDAMDDRQRTLVIENEELIKTVQKLNDDLIQSKSQDFFFADLTEKKIEERTNDAKMNLQRSFEFQLDQLKSKNSEMKTHILTLKNRLVAYEEAPPTRQTAAESMETIVDLQSVIEDQKKTIQLLREEAATAAIRPVNGSKRMLRDCDQSHHYNSM